MVVRLLGLRFAYACAAPVAAYFSFVSPDIPATIDYQRRVFGPQPRWKQRWFICKHFFAFGLMIIDRFAILSGKARSYSFSFDGEQHLREAIAQGRGVVLLNAHFGNWEVGGKLLERTEAIVNIAGFDRESSSVRDMLDGASQARFRYIKLAGSPTDVLPLLAALRRGEIIAMLGDRAYGTPVTYVPFLGEPAPFPVGPYLLASLAGAPLLHVFSVREPGGHYRFIGFPPEHLTTPAHRDRPGFLSDCATRYAQRLEALVRRHPFQWYNFYPFWNPPPQS